MTMPDTGRERPSRWNLAIKIAIAAFVVTLVGIAFYAFRVVFIPLIIGALMAYILNPVVCRIQRWTHLPRGVATGLLYLALLVLVVPLVWALVPVVSRQIMVVRRQLVTSIVALQEIAPGTTISLLGYEVDIYNAVNELTSGLANFLTSLAPKSLTFVFGAARTSVLVVFTFVIGFYLTRDAPAAANWFRGLVPPTYGDDVARLVREIDLIWKGFLRGQIILVSVVAVILTVLSYALGLPHPLALGIFGGLLEFLPSIGNMIWGMTAVISALVGGSTAIPMPTAVYVLIVVVAYVAFAQIEVNILLPYIVGGRLRLHPVVVLVGVIVGASIGGVLGVLLAAPTMASMRVVGRYLYARMFDLEPFPLVGPVALPSDEREAEIKRMEAESARPEALEKVLSRTVDLASRSRAGARSRLAARRKKRGSPDEAGGSEAN